MTSPRKLARQLFVAAGTAVTLGCAPGAMQIVEEGWRHEQQTLDVQDPTALPPAAIPTILPPRTVSDEAPPRVELPLTLNEALRISLENAKVVRSLAGISAVNSGSTIYDPAITNTGIDQQQARFDPTINQSNTLNRSESPNYGFDQFTRGGLGFSGPRTDNYQATIGVGKINTLGGNTTLNIVQNPTQVFGIGTPILNPSNRYATELQYTQPLLRGGGFYVNTAPIVLARIDTQRSYFQFKDSMQELVRGTIEAYWALVFARLDVWARQIQVDQADEAYKREAARKEFGLGDLRNVAQARVTLNQFRASLIGSKASVLDREAALRNILGLSPSDGRQIIPVSAPATTRYKHEWDKLLQLSEQRRPDIIELKLILEADKQRLLQAENTALPTLNANALYRWNGLSGEIPGGKAATAPGQYTDWTLGVTFSVPLGLREGRARIREQDLIILKDRSNLEQGLHFTGHQLAISVRGLESSYEQYLAFRQTRTAALENLLIQIEEQRVGRGIYLSVLQALNDWGNAITSEARSLIDYNVSLATLERQTGTILETHGVILAEERFTAAGPFFREREYPMDVKPTGETNRYPGTGEPGENAFELKKPPLRGTELAPIEENPVNPPKKPGELPNPKVDMAPPKAEPIKPSNFAEQK